MSATHEAKAAGSVGLPDTVEWTLRNQRSGEMRMYVQQELTIEGEARLLALVRKTADALNVDGFPWEALGPLFDDDTPTDWQVVAQLLGIIGERLPDVVGECCAILLSVYPTNEDGTKNPDYDGDVRFIRGSIRFSNWVDMIRLFTEQNDYQRLADPIGAILGAAARTGMATTQTSLTSTSTPDTSDDDATSDGS